MDETTSLRLLSEVARIAQSLDEIAGRLWPVTSDSDADAVDRDLDGVRGDIADIKSVLGAVIPAVNELRAVYGRPRVVIPRRPEPPTSEKPSG